MATLHIRGGRIVDPSQKIDTLGDLVLCDGKVAGIGADATKADRTIDATGLIVCPGLVDMHVHLREPGNEEDETIATGVAAALAGGVTSLACIPNTRPALDTQAAIELVYLQAARAGGANVFPVGAVTKGREGTELAELGLLVESGAVAFTDDGSPVASPEIMRRALEYCRMFDKVVLNHCEARELTRGGVMHEGFVSMTLGLPGMPAAAEDVMVSRDITLAELTGGRVHVMHISTAGSVDTVRRALKRGVRVTTEACPHHFTLTDECLRSFDSNFKMSPPLRSQRDVDAVIEGLVDGTIGVIATDHAPHAPEKKMRELDQAPFGIVGLETLIPLCVHGLIEPGHLDWPAVIEKLTVNPSRILGVDKGTLRIGADADVTLIDPEARWTIDATKFRSKSRNTPYDGWKVKGRAAMTIVGGEVKYECKRVV